MQGLQQPGALALTLALDWLNARDTDTDQRLPRRASNQQTLALDWNEGPWQLGGTLLNVGSRPDAGAQLPAYQLLNLNARWRFERAWQLEARLQNALGQDYEPVRDYQGAGRQFWVGLRYDGRGFEPGARSEQRRAVVRAAAGLPAAAALGACRAAAAHRQPAAVADRERLRAGRLRAAGRHRPLFQLAGQRAGAAQARRPGRRADRAHRRAASPTWCWPRPRRAPSTRLEALGLQVLVLDSHSHADVQRSLVLLAPAAGHAARRPRASGPASSASCAAAAARVPAALRGQRVYFEVDAAPYAAGRGVVHRRDAGAAGPGATSCRPSWAPFRSSTPSSWCAPSPTS